MKTVHNLFLIVGCITLLSGCLGALPNTEKAEPIHFVPSSTMTLTSTPAATFTPVLPSVTPTFTATPTQPFIPTLSLNRNSSVLQLTTPSPEGFLILIAAINTQYSYINSHYGYENQTKTDFMRDELSNLRDVIDAETKFYYPDGLPNSEIVWDYYPPANAEWFFLFPSAYLDILTEAVLEDLNRGHHSLKDQETIEGYGYTVKIYEVELDHDPQPEWLVRMDWEKITALSWLILDQNPDRTYTKLKLSLPNELWLPATWEERIEVLQDFTGDGLTDIILINQGYAMGTDFLSFYIARGTKDGFQELRSMSKSTSVTIAGDGDYYKIEIPSDSKWLSLTLLDPHNINWGCTWNTQTSYRWPYGSEQISVSGKETPHTLECFLARAVSVYDSVDNATAVNLLENAILHFDQNDSEQRGKLLFAHYRVSVLYALMNKDSLARQHLEWLVQNSSDSEWFLKENIVLLLAEEKINAIKLCDSMYHASETEIPEGWIDDLDATAAVHAYPYSHEIYPPAICPLREIVTQKINQVNLNLQAVSEKVLEDQDIPVVAIQRYPLFDQERPASFLIVGADTLFVLGYVPTREGWEWRLMTSFYSKDSRPQTLFEDVTGDGFPELAYFQQNQYWYCYENEEAYEIFLTTSAGIGFVSLSRTVCHPADQTFEITDYLSDKDKDGVVDWVTDQISEYAGDAPLTTERDAPATWFTPEEIRAMLPEQYTSDENKVDLISELYESRKPSMVREKLLDERNALDTSDPFADRTWQKLTYLIAISYEMEGKTDEAIKMFTSVLQSESQTLWGNLAELHLMPK